MTKTPQQIRNEVEKGCGKLIPLEENNPNSWKVTCGAWINDKIRLCSSCLIKLSILTEYDKSIKEMIENFRQELKHCDEFFNVNDYENTQSTDKFMGIVELFLKQELLSKIGDNSEVKK